jgi:signal peptidase II
MNRHRVFWWVFVAAIILDQSTKFWARSTFAPRESPGLPWPGVFEFTLTYNEGIAFGMLQGFGLFLAPIAIAIAVAAYAHSKRHPEDSAWMHVAMGLLAGGALGNLWDRLVYRKVTDMFWFRAIDFPVFNIADSCITIAATILIVHWLGELTSGRSRDPRDPAPGDNEGVQGPGVETVATDAP